MATRVVLLVLLLAGFAPAARGQTVVIVSGAQSLLLDPSVRSSGMGLSSNSVFWGDAPNDWANPALLAYRHGIGYEWGRAQLIPDLDENVVFSTKRFTVGAWGAGILVAGKPFGGIGRVRLDYGDGVAVDSDGNPVFTFPIFEETRAFAVGVNLLEFGRHALHKAGREIPDLTRYGDIAVGWSVKRTHVSLVPATLLL
ncbi:MAG TPA: hypothetical protein VFD83_00555, partial [Candidatus Polarisedimenticolia bacterium]|nr:hypothetical protein [Candidatus Polarisedimenticolia bacterium]